MISIYCSIQNQQLTYIHNGSIGYVCSYYNMLPYFPLYLLFLITLFLSVAIMLFYLKQSYDS
jgi:hypothetical protein